MNRSPGIVIVAGGFAALRRATARGARRSATSGQAGCLPWTARIAGSTAQRSSLICTPGMGPEAQL